MFTFLWEDVYIGVLDEKCTCEIETVFNCTLIGSSLLKKTLKIRSFEKGCRIFHSYTECVTF